MGRYTDEEIENGKIKGIPFAIMSDEEKIEKLGWRNDGMSYAILSLNKGITKGGHNIVNKDRYTVIGKRKYHRGAS